MQHTRHGGAKKSLGQHFLTSPSALAAIISAANIREGESVLEIGPGKGVLTRALLAQGARVTAVEKDHRLLPLLHEEFSKEIMGGQLTLVEADALQFIPESQELKALRYKVVANIPYYITGKILRHLFSAATLPERVVLLLQREVAERAARDSKESVLSLSLKCYGSPVYVKTVPAGAFSPPPKVDSAILSIQSISRDFFTEFPESFWFSLIKTGFGQKRKKLLGNLGRLFSKKELAEAFHKLAIPENARAEDLSTAEWRRLAAALYRLKKS